MRRNAVYSILLALLVCCAPRIGEQDLQNADFTLAQADSLENTIYTYADTLALQEAVELFSRTQQTTKATKAVYHLGKAYLLYEQDSLAAVCFRQAADEFLLQSDSIYYPLSVLELSLIAERHGGKGSQTTMLRELRFVQQQMIRRQGRAKRNVWIVVTVVLCLLAGAAASVYLLIRRKPAQAVVSREDLERNIELVLSQGSVGATLHWQDYQAFWKTANAYLYNAADKLLAAQPQLSEQDLRFCILVLLDLPAKEIADIMNLSQNSISNKKTRTAQKLGTIAANLRETIISITLKSAKQ